MATSILRTIFTSVALLLILAPVSLMSGGMHIHDQALRQRMHEMMAEDADDIDYFGIPGPKGSASLLQKQKSDDQYLQESAEALSKVLGKNWDSKELERKADESTQALLHGIGSKKSLRTISSLMGLMMGQ
mmetsp:Transcript_3070/g.6906  ORF Transcript_3070/g.6906 Transcript_3070/m.6906 type:complete len:131 (+) Transcript_3070:99-491(+)|eukprot:CAMPEP_0178427940 /NCGR_PEP_ID=MMETSP0689_2-20121128/30011_1 /TAXON_ID=160604 /ORGANISM="Amphidinium massartii, Strain CS-259" /LENGTH=130 /DNA_ID=CAMNT_0020049677 /DNA_START=99 /DNA_END=491 /DNA_ORIENTATION=+